MAQDPRPQPSDDPEEFRQQPQAEQPEEQQRSEVLPEAHAHESVKAAVQRMWDVVKRGADIIVTLRQENQILQNQLSSLRKSEEQLQNQVEDFLGRIDALEKGAPVDTNPGQNIDRLEDRINDLEHSLHLAQEQLEKTTEELRAKQAELEATAEQLEDQTEVTQQLSQLRNELEARTQLLQELQESFDHRDVSFEPDDERDRLQAELDRALAIIDTYRAAGLRHLESNEDQLALFAEGKVDTTTLTNEELLALSQRLEGVAKRLDELFGLS